jgi:hypothetical protein
VLSCSEINPINIRAIPFPGARIDWWIVANGGSVRSAVPDRAQVARGA